jgi:hypothetical protein
MFDALRVAIELLWCPYGTAVMPQVLRFSAKHLLLSSRLTVPLVNYGHAAGVAVQHDRSTCAHACLHARCIQTCQPWWPPPRPYWAAPPRQTMLPQQQWRPQMAAWRQRAWTPQGRCSRCGALAGLRCACSCCDVRHGGVAVGRADGDNNKAAVVLRARSPALSATLLCAIALPCSLRPLPRISPSYMKFAVAD